MGPGDTALIFLYPQTGMEIRLLHEIVFDIDEFLTPPKNTANYIIRTRTYPLIYYPDPVSYTHLTLPTILLV